MMKDFALSEEQLEKQMKMLSSCLRPISADEAPIIGPLSHFPNVILNVGYGAHGGKSLYGA